MTPELSDALVNWAGLLGVVLYLGAYGALQAGFLRGAGYAYATLNLVAAALVLISLSQAFNLSSAIIQIFWIVISLFGIVRLFLLNHRLRFSEEERELMEDVLPDMPRPMARRFLNAGVWTDADEGTELTAEGKPVTHLHYLSSGGAEVISGDKKVAEIAQGFIGEMNVLGGGPASATVLTDMPSRMFTVSGETLQRMTRADNEFRLYLEQCLSAATRRKLIAANARIAEMDKDA